MNLLFIVASSHQVVGLVIVREEGLPLPVLVLHERLDVQVEALRGRALRGLRGQLALLKEESQQGEQWVSEIERDSFECELFATSETPRMRDHAPNSRLLTHVSMYRYVKKVKG